MRYMIIIRDWKGTYDDMNLAKGWELFESEDNIDTGQDCLATIFSKGKSTKKISGQKVYDIYNSLECNEDVEGYELDKERQNILIEKEA